MIRSLKKIFAPNAERPLAVGANGGGVQQRRLLKGGLLASLVEEKVARKWSAEEILFWALEWNRRDEVSLPDVEVYSIVNDTYRLRYAASSIPPGTSGITDLSQLPSVWDLDAKFEWVVEGLIVEGSVTVISSQSGTGKTWLAYFIAGAVAHGRKILGRAVRQAKVLYLDGENPRYVAKRNVEDLGIDQTPNLTIWGGWVDSPPPRPNAAIVQRFAKEHRGLIIYDPLVAFHTGDEQSASETRRFMHHFRTLADMGATVVVLHHAGKGENAQVYRGSSDIKGAVDTMYLLESAGQNNGKLGKLRLKCEKGRIAPGQNLGLEFRPGAGFVDFDVPVSSSVDPSRIVREIVEQEPGLNQSQIVERAKGKGVSKHKVEEALKGGEYESQQGKGREKRYHLKQLQPS